MTRLRPVGGRRAVGERRAAMRSYVHQHREGVRAAEVAVALGLDEKQVGVYLGREVEDGRLARLGRGLYGPVGVGNPTRGRGLSGHERAPHSTVKWLTPPRWIDALGGAESFNLDPCAAPDAPYPWPTAREHYREGETDGLTAPWWGRVWLNPPFGHGAEKWVEKLVQHGRGTLLYTNHTETVLWQQHVFPRATAVLHPDHRPRFHRPDGTPGKNTSTGTIVLVAFGDDDAERLARSGISGALVTGWSLCRNHTTDRPPGAIRSTQGLPRRQARRAHRTPT